MAQEKLPPAVAAVIDYQRIIRDAKAARSVRDQVESRRELQLQEIAKEEQRLHELDRDLGRRRSVMTREAFEEERRKFDEDVERVQRMVQERKRELDQVTAAALTEVRAAMLEIIGELSEVHGFNIVLPTSAVLLFSPQINLTEDVLARLDEKLPSVKVPERAE